MTKTYKQLEGRGPSRSDAARWMDSARAAQKWGIVFGRAGRYRLRLGFGIGSECCITQVRRGHEVRIARMTPDSAEATQAFAWLMRELDLD